MFAFTWMRTRAAVTQTKVLSRGGTASTKGTAGTFRPACFADFISAKTRVGISSNSLGAFFPVRGFRSPFREIVWAGVMVR